MLLAVLLALVPLTMAYGGGGLHLHLGLDPAGASVLDADGLPNAREGVANRAENVVPNAGHGHQVVLPAPRIAAAFASRSGASLRGSPLRGARIGAPQAAATAEVWNVRKQLRLTWPLRGAITSGFGWRTHPIFGTKEFHTGIDIAGSLGTPIVAAYWGTVRYVGYKGGYGEVVVVDHGHGVETSYAHLSSARVKPGALVEEGEEIGRTGSTGWSTGPHLFFEVYEDGVPRNPTGFLP
jgi:murein DD-endopeptidase MepM/ murein hydrolase activator NlpD